ncbi:hypothetical protein Ancab_002169 [Ancistrocladus abbreviatus]
MEASPILLRYCTGLKVFQEYETKEPKRATKMVFYFKARPDASGYIIFMGLDKYENEELIKYGLPEDIWFPPVAVGSMWTKCLRTVDDVSEGLLEDCAQSVKSVPNSKDASLFFNNGSLLAGNKVNNIDVVYTPWSNLKKTASMDVVQVCAIGVEKRINEVLSRLNPTKVERKPDLKASGKRIVQLKMQKEKLSREKS